MLMVRFYTHGNYLSNFIFLLMFVFSIRGMCHALIVDISTESNSWVKAVIGYSSWFEKVI